MATIYDPYAKKDNSWASRETGPLSDEERLETLEWFWAFRRESRKEHNLKLPPSNWKVKVGGWFYSSLILVALLLFLHGFFVWINNGYAWSDFVMVAGLAVIFCYLCYHEKKIKKR